MTIVSARYAPCEGKRSLLTGELVEGNNPIPDTRDVTPFVRALLIAQKRREDVSDGSFVETTGGTSNDGDEDAGALDASQEVRRATLRHAS